jgi:hypothetical protein
VEEHWPRSDSA